MSKIKNQYQCTFYSVVFYPTAVLPPTTHTHVRAYTRTRTHTLVLRHVLPGDHEDTDLHTRMSMEYVVYRASKGDLANSKHVVTPT